MAAKKKAAAKKAAPKKSIDAITLLKNDHETVRGLLSQFENATGTRREKLRGQIEQELKVHTTIEEEIFYPAFREASRKKDDKKLYFEAVEEHHVVDMVIPELNDGRDNEELKAKAKVLKDIVEHHAEEEETEMFPRARKLFSRDELRSLGEQMQLRKEALKA